MSNVIVPEIRKYEAVAEQIRQQYEIYRVEREKTLPQFKLENIHFEHDPMWKYRAFSIQGAHDCNNAVWVTTKYAFIAAGVAPYILRMML